MSKQTATAKNETNTNVTRALKKVSATQINLSKQPAGFEIEGKFVGLTERERADEEGEIKKMFTMVIEAANGERTKFLADAGLRMALEDAMITAGDWFKAVKGQKTDIGKGRTMNQWDIYQYADEN